MKTSLRTCVSLLAVSLILSAGSAFAQRAGGRGLFARGGDSSQSNSTPSFQARTMPSFGGNASSQPAAAASAVRNPGFRLGGMSSAPRQTTPQAASLPNTMLKFPHGTATPAVTPKAGSHPATTQPFKLATPLTPKTIPMLGSNRVAESAVKNLTAAPKASGPVTATINRDALNGFLKSRVPTAGKTDNEVFTTAPKTIPMLGSNRLAESAVKNLTAAPKASGPVTATINRDVLNGFLKSPVSTTGKKDNEVFTDSPTPKPPGNTSGYRVQIDPNAIKMFKDNYFKDKKPGEDSGNKRPPVNPPPASPPAKDASSSSSKGPSVTGTFNPDVIKGLLDHLHKKSNGSTPKNPLPTLPNFGKKWPLPPPQTSPNTTAQVFTPPVVRPTVNTVPVVVAPIVANSPLVSPPKNIAPPKALMADQAPKPPLDGGIRAKLKMEKQDKGQAGSESDSEGNVRSTQSALTDPGKDKQEDELNKILGALEPALLAAAGANKQEVEDAINKAKGGDTTALEALITKLAGQNPPPQDLVDGLKAYFDAANLLGAVGNDGPLDAATLAELKKLLEGSNLPGINDGTKGSLADLEFWNRVIEEESKLADGGNGGAGGSGTQTDPLYDYLALLLSLAGNGGAGGGLGVDPGFGGGGYPMDPGYGYGDPGYGYGDPGYGYGDAGYGSADPGYAVGGSSGVSVPANTVATTPPAAPETVAAQPVVLANPKANQHAVSYVLADAYTYEMKAGEQQQLDARSDGPWVVTFDRGDGSQPARYSLSEGTYEFKLTEKGWELFRKQYDVTIDNSDLPIDFAYVVDGQQASVSAGQKQTHSGSFPLEVIFDRGDNGEPAKMQLESGVYKVGVDAAKQRLDLLAADQVAQAGL